MDLIREAVRRMEGGNKAQEAQGKAANGHAMHELASSDFPTTHPLSADELSDLKLTHSAMRDENVYMAFSSLRTHVIQKLGRHDCSIVVSSVAPGGGASFVAMNLAAAFASDSTRSAILLDCNFSGSRYKDLGDDESVPGITDYVYGSPGITLDDLMLDVGIPRLRLLPGGKLRSNRVELFTRPRTQQMFEELRSRFPDSAIIVDAPSPSASANANVIASYCDGVVLVVPYGQVTQQDVRVVARSFPEGKILGSVFNDVPHWRMAK